MNCEKCGTSIPDGASSCAFCGQAVTIQSSPAQTKSFVSKPKSENMITGIVGALIGATIGGAVILLLSQLGFVASISGLILAVCTLKGYELLGRRLSIKGFVICLVLIAVTPYIADRLDWAIVIQKSFSDMNISLGDAFSIVPDLIAEGYIEKSNYIGNLLMIYVFAALGAFSTLRDLFRK
ncbi:MAG: zinc ribbon domain-containing protein [Lachnospiraceae bacterium]|nr:zinc ribbon domain-containing protein [Lachnospiraceae bacterium]